MRFAVNCLRELRLVTNEMVGWFFKFVGGFCIWQLLISQYPGIDCPGSAVARDYLISGDWRPCLGGSVLWLEYSVARTDIDSLFLSRSTQTSMRDERQIQTRLGNIAHANI